MELIKEDNEHESIFAIHSTMMAIERDELKGKERLSAPQAPLDKRNDLKTMENELQKRSVKERDDKAPPHGDLSLNARGVSSEVSSTSSPCLPPTSSLMQAVQRATGKIPMPDNSEGKVEDESIGSDNNKILGPLTPQLGSVSPKGSRRKIQMGRNPHQQQKKHHQIEIKDNRAGGVDLQGIVDEKEKNQRANETIAPIHKKNLPRASVHRHAAGSDSNNGARRRRKTKNQRLSIFNAGANLFRKKSHKRRPTISMLADGTLVISEVQD